MSIRHRARVLVREVDALAQIDSEYFCVRVLGIENRVSAQSRSGIEDEAFVSKKLPQALDGLESVALQIPVHIHRAAGRLVTEVRNAFPLPAETFLSLPGLFFERLVQEKTRHALADRVPVSPCTRELAFQDLALLAFAGLH